MSATEPLKATADRTTSAGDVRASTANVQASTAAGEASDGDAQAPAADVLDYAVEGPGHAPLVVVLHGWGSSAMMMRGFPARLSDRFRVANVDLPGHGKAPVPTTALGMEEHADAVADLIRSLGGKAHLIGHSNGGRIGLYMASRPPYRDLVRSLTLISPSGVRRPRGPQYHLRRWTASVLKAPFSLLPGRAREHGLDWLRHSLVWQFLGSSDYRSLNGTMRETFVRLVNTYVDQDLKQIGVPTLLFWGEDDDAVLESQVRRIEREIPDCGLVVLDDAGHYGFLDRPETVYAATGHFLDHLEGTP